MAMMKGNMIEFSFYAGIFCETQPALYRQVRVRTRRAAGGQRLVGRWCPCGNRRHLNSNQGGPAGRDPKPGRPQEVGDPMPTPRWREPGPKLCLSKNLGGKGRYWYDQFSNNSQNQQSSIYLSLIIICVLLYGYFICLATHKKSNQEVSCLGFLSLERFISF